MSVTYTLNSTSMNCGYISNISSSYWNNLIGADANGNMIGKYGNFYRMTNVMFDQTALASLRSKTVTSIKLVLTLANAARIRASTWTVLPIGYKLNSTTTTTSSGSAWTRSDADSTAQSTDTVGYIRAASGDAYQAAVGDTLTVTMSGKVPKYGYVLGATNDASEYYMVKISAAKLVVVTNEPTVRIVNSNNTLDRYIVNIVNSSNGLDMYKVYVVNDAGTGLVEYS